MAEPFQTLKRVVVNALTPVKGAKPQYALAVRTAFASFVATVVGLVVASPIEAIFAGIVAQFVGLVSVGPSYRYRLKNTLATAIVLPCLLFLGFLALQYTWSTVMFMGLAAGLAGFGCLFGVQGTTFAMLIPLSVTIAYAFSGSFSAGVEVAVASVLGGLWGVVVVIATWPFDGRSLLRRTVANAWRAYATFTAVAAKAVAGDAKNWTVTSSHERAEMVTALGACTQALAGRSHGAARELAEMAGTLDRLVITTVVAADACAHSGSHEPLDAIALAAKRGADAVSANQDMDALERAGDIDAAAAVVGAKDGDEHLQDVLAAAADAYRDHGSGAAKPLEGAYGDSFLAAIRANLTFDSIVARHALRFGLTAAVAALIMALSGLTEGYWMILTVCVLMRPSIAVTRDRLVQRISGTVIGVCIAMGLVVALAGMVYPTALIANILLFLMIAFMPKNYVFWVLALTPYVILTLSIALPGEWTLGVWRLVNTLIGAALVLASTYLLWPSRGARVLSHDLAEALGRLAAYLSSLLPRSEADPGAVGGMRRSAAVAEMNVRGAIDGYLAEPREQGPDVNLADRIAVLSRRVRSNAIGLETFMSGVGGRQPSTAETGLIDGLGSNACDVLGEIADAVSNAHPLTEAIGHGPDPSRLHDDVLTAQADRSVPPITPIVVNVARMAFTLRQPAE